MDPTAGEGAVDGPTDRKDARERPPGGQPLPPHLDPRRGSGRPAGPASGPAGSFGAAGRNPGLLVPDRPRRRRGTRVLAWIAVVTSLAVLATAGAGYALLNYYDGNINRIDAFGFGSDGRPAAAPRDARNILIVGSDSRGDLEAGEGTQGRGDTFVTGQRSDTVILAHLYGDADMAQLVSFPRDSFVAIPEHLSSSGKLVPERNARLNTAFFEGGPGLLIRTIERLTDLRIDNYMQIDFDGFQAMVNTLGGVEVCLSEAAKEGDSGIDLQAGRQIVRGDQALAFVRQRKGLPRGDLDRIARQQQFIGAIVRKTLSAGTLLNPFKLNGVINAVTESLVIDQSLSIGELRNLALRFRNFDAGGVIFSTVPVADNAARRGGASVVLLDEAKSAELFGQLRRDIPPGVPKAEPPAPAPGERLVVAPADVRVKVSNGTGVQGLGRRAYDDLSSVGFQLVGEPGNRPGSPTGTVVLHGPGKADSARTVVAAIPGATAKLDPKLTQTLEVVVGSGYSGTKPVTVSGAPPSRSAAPAPAASAPPVQTAAQDPCAV